MERAPHPLKEDLRQLAKEAGLPLFGVSAPRYAPLALTRVKAWLEAGRHAEMAWLAKRGDLALGLEAVFPEARSVVVVGYPYAAPKNVERGEEDSGGLGRLSLYAQGRDYHYVMAQAMRPLLAKLQSAGSFTKGGVDSGPFLERELARQAGLGFIGKSGLLINPQYGSYFHLGVIATSVALPPDEPLAVPGCASCNLCIDACPTRALSAEQGIDCRLCISYHTLENRNKLMPEVVMARLGDRLAGCDVCQRVCPFNRSFDTHVARKPLLPPRVDLATLFREDEAAFAERYAGSVLLRPGLLTLRRNALLVARHTRTLPALRPFLSDESHPILRATYIWAHRH